jgi:hypothetical protein
MKTVLNIYLRGVKIKISQSRYCHDASSTKRVYRKIFVLVCIWRTICSYETMVEKMVMSTVSFSNVYEVEMIIVIIIGV